MPENPGEQLQLNALIRSVQVPLFKQGLPSHSFISEGNNNHKYKLQTTTTTTKKKQETTLTEGSLLHTDFNELKLAKESYKCQ